jgi:putative flavoprotein involved in K+ transport
MVRTDYASYRTRQVVIATGGFQKSRIPPLAHMLPGSVTQLHSSEYRNPSQIAPGDVLVVGGANSGVQIAQELSGTHDVTLAMGSTPLMRLPTHLLGRSIFAWLEATGAMDLTSTSPIGSRWSRREVLIGESPARIARSHGVRLVKRVVGVEGHRLRSVDGAITTPRTIVWATGFKPTYDWLKVPVLDLNGRPQHTRGVTNIKGLYFLGLPWQHTRGSALLGWVARDAEFLAGEISRQFGRPGAVGASAEAA